VGVPAFPRQPQNQSRDSWKTVEVQTISIGFESKFGSCGAGDMDLQNAYILFTIIDDNDNNYC